MTIVTAITNNKDRLREDMNFTQGKFVAFTDQVSPNWEIRPTYNLFSDPIRNAKIHKVLIHKYVSDDISIWIDGNISFNVPANILVDEFLGDGDIFAFTHRFRDCIYNEMPCCIHHETVKDFINRQIDRYKSEEYPSNAGLYECGFLIRRNNDRVRRFNEAWWAEICVGSKRDQLSFPYVLWKNLDIKIKTHPSNVREHPYFDCRGHIN